MKKRVFGTKFSRDRGSRKALFRSIIGALVEHDEIITTKAKAKAVQGQIDKLITVAKKNDLSAQRKVYAFFGSNKNLGKRFLKEIIPAFSNRKSGFTKIINLPERRGDRAEIVKFMWSDKIKQDEKGKVAKDLKDKGKSKGSTTKAVSKTTGKKSLGVKLPKIKKRELEK